MSLRLGLGAGLNGKDTFGARLAAGLDVWLLPALGLGVLAANSAQIYRFEAARSYWLLAPVVSTRSSTGGGQLFASGALGLVKWSCAPGPCEDEGEVGRTGAGGELAAGYHVDLGWLLLGPQLGLAAIAPHVPGGETNVMFTVNLSLELAFGRSTGQEAGESASASPPGRARAPLQRRR